MAIAVGAPAPDVEGVEVPGPRALVFFKVTCDVTQMVAPALERLGRAYPGRVVGVGQDPPPELEAFARRYGVSFPLVPDLDPYTASDGYDVASAPTGIAVDADGRVVAVAESWDRDAWNHLSATLAGLLEVEPVAVSEPGDGLPEFKPG